MLWAGVLVTTRIWFAMNCCHLGVTVTEEELMVRGALPHQRLSVPIRDIRLIVQDRISSFAPWRKGSGFGFRGVLGRRLYSTASGADRGVGVETHRGEVFIVETPDADALEGALREAIGVAQNKLEASRNRPRA